jgi:hypothetical protein
MEPNRPDSHGNLRLDCDVTHPNVLDLSACSQCSAHLEDVIAPFGWGPHRGYIYPRIAALSTIPH